MMRNPFQFFLELLRQPAWIPLWVFFLMLVNMASVAFWSERLAKAIFITFLVSAALMMGMYARFGFSKILGMGHVLWIPLLIYVAFQIPRAESGFKTYLVVFSVSIAVSLTFDIIDVWQYFKHRTPG
jgi:hypothetical protein